MISPYHLTVIGTRFPQLALATLMARRGRKVLIVDFRKGLDDPEGTSPTGFRFRRRPVPMFGLDKGGLLRRFLDEIGIGHVLVTQTYPPNAVSYQVVLPRHRLNVYPERDRLMAEIGREFPDSVEVIGDLYEEWDRVAADWYDGYDDLEEMERTWVQTRGLISRFRGFFHSRKLGDRINSLKASSPQADFFHLQHHFLGGFTPGGPVPPLSASLIHDLGRRGSFQESAGTQGLTRLLLQRYKEYGGTLLEETGVLGVSPSAGDLLNLNLSGGGTIETRALATSSGIAESIEGLTQKKPAVKTRGMNLNHPVRFYLGLEDRVIPRGMEDNVFFMREDDGGPLGLKRCFLALSPAASELAPPGKRSLTVTCLVPGNLMEGITPDSARAAREDLLPALEAVIPFLGEGLVSVSSDLEPDREFRTPRVLPGGLAAWTPGIIGRTAVSSRFRGRVAVVRGTPWELGIEGEALAALSAAGVLRKAIAADK